MNALLRWPAGRLAGLAPIAPIALVALVAILAIRPAAVASAPGDGAAPRLVSLAPHLTELAFDAGAGPRLVGVVEWSDFPAEARGLPRIGDAFRMDAERIVALGATHALAWGGGTPSATIGQLEGLGIEVVVVTIDDLEDISKAIERIGEVAGTGERAAASAQRFRTRLNEHRDAVPGGPPARVFYQVSRRPLFTLGGRHVINEVLALCGARNVFAELDVEAAPVGVEAVLDAAPDVILVGADDEREAIRSTWGRYDDLPAVRCGRVRGVRADTLVRPSTRILDGAGALCDWLDEVRPASNPECGIGLE